MNETYIILIDDKGYWDIPNIDASENNLTDQYIKSKIKFRYFGDISISKGNGKVIVAHIGNKCGIAWCSPKDKFSKKIGRNIAIDRLFTTPIKLKSDNLQYTDWINLFLSNEVNTPNWFFKDSNI